MSLLTEEELATREDIFFAVVNEIVTEHYPDVALEPLTEEDAYLFSILLDHFVEEYKNPTLYETYVASTLGQDAPDHNDALYEELVDLLLDESIGSKIASIAHGVQHFLAGKKHGHLVKRKAGAEAKVASAKKKSAAYARKMGKQPKASGVAGHLKSGWQKERSAVLKGRVASAKAEHGKAEKRAQAAETQHQEAGAKRSELAKKIDTGIAAKKSELARKVHAGVSNVKKKVTSTINKGATRLGAAASRVASKFH